jgi:predicted Zn-dependent peptidase
MPTIGTEKTIKSITAEMLREYFQTYYIPRNMVLACAGCVSHEQVRALAEKYFSRPRTGGKVVGKDYFRKVPAKRKAGPGFAFQYDLDSQIQLQACFRSCSYHSPDYYGVYLINRILDDGVASRLQVALREKLGLVYAIESRLTSLSDVGTFDFDVTVSPEKIAEVTRVLLREIGDFARYGPTAEELEHVKKRYLYDLDFDLDDPYKQILRYGFVQLYSEEVTVDEEKAIIEAITVRELHALAQKLFTRDNLNLILVGPFTPELKTELEKPVLEF